MTDVFSKEKRSWVMSRIQSRNTKTENLLAKTLKKAGIKFKRYPKMFGKPDFLIINAKTVIFIDGCFWHKCPKHFTTPKSRESFWLKKIGTNVRRDRKVNRALKREGFRVIRVWEHEIERGLPPVLTKLLKGLANHFD